MFLAFLILILILTPSDGVAQLNNVGGQDIFFGKYTNDGELIWIKQIAGYSDDRATNIVINESGDISITGYFSEIVDFDPSENNAFKQSNGGKDMFLGVYNNDGEFIDVVTIGGTGYDNCFFNNFDNEGNIYFAGFFENTVDLNPFEGTEFATSNGGADIFVEKLYFDGVNIESNIIANNISVYPNPAKNILNIVISNEIKTDVEIELVNIKGQNIICKQFYCNKIQLQLPENLSGMYLLKIKYNNNEIVKKIIIE